MSSLNTRNLLNLIPVFVVLGALCGCRSTASPNVKPDAVLSSDTYLQHLVGRWDIERSIRGKVVGNFMSVEPVLGGNFVRMHMQSSTPTDPYEAMVLVGFDADRGDYVVYWCDSFGPSMSAVGRGKRDGDRLEIRFDYADSPFFNTWVHLPESDSWTFTYENGSADGSRSLFAHDIVRRRPTK